MGHEHNQQNTCQYCLPKSNEPIFTPGVKTKLTSFLGVCGCLSCYIAMFPAILLGIVGIFGLSSSQTLGALNAYMASELFQPILIISILLLIVGLLRYGKIPIVLSVLAGIGIFVSMNFYMRSWFFTFSFVLLAFAYFLAYRKLTHSTGSGLMVSEVESSKSTQLKTALVLISAVVILGVIDIGRTAFSSPNPQNNSVPQQQMPPSMMQMQ